MGKGGCLYSILLEGELTGIDGHTAIHAGGGPGTDFHSHSVRTGTRILFILGCDMLLGRFGLIIMIEFRAELVICLEIDMYLLEFPLIVLGFTHRNDQKREYHNCSNKQCEKFELSHQVHHGNVGYA